MSTSIKEQFLLNEAAGLFGRLKADTEPTFGLMTAQHMVEHLIMSIKTSLKRYGEPEAGLSERTLGFRKFLERGAVFKHRPSDKTKADLPDLKYASLEDAIAEIPVALDRFYGHFQTNPDFKCYNQFMGELNFEELELFHYQHVRYHLWQFGIIENYP